MRFSARALSAVLVMASAAVAQTDALPLRSQVLDSARIFSPEAVQDAKKILDDLERASAVPVTIETVDSIDGSTIEEAALDAARRSGGQGVFLLIAKKEHKISRPLVRRQFEHRLPKEAREKVHAAMAEDFQAGKFDDGLRRGAAILAESVRATATATAAAPAPTVTTTPSAADSPLVARNQIKLTLAGARTVLAGAEAQAARMGQKSNIAVVDDGGHLLAFARMDGARPASAASAQTKATSAAIYRAPTGPIAPGGPGSPPDLLTSLSLQNAMAASGAKYSSLLGGVPIVVDGQVIGAVGVGGGTGEQDAEVAKAGIEAFLDAVKGKPIDEK